MGDLSGRSLAHYPTDIYEIIGDHTESHPALHSVVTFVSATIQTVSPLDHADATLASGAPFLAVAEPALPLLALTIRASARPIGNAHTFDTHGFRCRLVPDGIEPGISRHQSRDASQLRLVRCDGVDQEIGIMWSPGVDLIVGRAVGQPFLRRRALALGAMAVAAGNGRRPLPALWADPVMGSWRRLDPALVSAAANPTHHYEGRLRSSISLSDGWKAPRRRCGGQVRKCSLNTARSILLGRAPCRATTWPRCAAARKYRAAVPAL